MAEIFLDLNKKALTTIKDLVKKEALSVTSITKAGNNWDVLVDVLERRAVPDTQDLIGTYKLTFDKGKDLQGYKRVELRHRGDTGTEELVEEAE